MTLGYRRDDEAVHPPLDVADYRSTAQRHPREPLVRLPHGLTEVTGPQLGTTAVGPLDHDLTRQHDGAPLGERILVGGRVLDGDGRPLRGALIEVWQANAAGRYRHAADGWAAPLDPNFSGAGRAVTDDDGRYELVTIKPGAYPWGNAPNAWRPAHIHFSLLGEAFAQRLVTQMYFPGDPLCELDPIFNAVRDERARSRLVARFSTERTSADWALGYDFDIVLRGREQTPLEEAR
jgi:protocatechuate 3,4-dioxygenase beta subunit